MTGEEDVERTEVEALLETRHELGPSYDRALVDSFADRIEAAVAARTAHDLQRHGRADRDRAAAGPRQLALGIVTGVAGIPVTAISLAASDSGATGLAALLISWSGLVGINVAHAAQSRSSRRRD
jgi:hypothetical protein